MARATKPRRAAKPAKVAASTAARTRIAWLDPGTRRRLATIAQLGRLVVLFAPLFDWNLLKRPMEQRVSAAIGREVRSLDDLEVDFFPLTVQAGGFWLGNASWST